MKKRVIRFCKKYSAIILNVIILGLSLLGALGVIKTIDLWLGGGVLNNSLFAVVLFFIEFLLYKKMVKRHGTRKGIFEVIFSLFLASVIIIGVELDCHDRIFWSFGSFAKIVCLSVFIFSLVNITVSCIQSARINNFNYKNRRKLFWITFAIILFGGILVWLATYPGIWGYDAATQYATVNNIDEEYTRSVGAHYSLPLGLVMSWIMNIGNSVFGSFQAGLAICCFLQMVFMSYVATRIVLFSVSRVKNIYLYTIAVLFFSFFPLYTAMTVYMTQDVLFGGFFALAFMNLYELATDKDYWLKKTKPIVLAIMFLLICLCRNNGFYCLLIAMPFALLFIREKKRWLVFLLFAIPLSIYWIYNGPVLNALDISTKSSIREMMSIPSQQIARVYNNSPDLLSKESLENINKYYKNYKNFSEYNQYPSISDFTKRYMVSEEVSGDMMGYLKLWLKLGLKDPKNYVEAFLMNNLGFWYPNKNYPDTRMGIPYFEYEMTDRGDERFLVINRDSKMVLYDEMLHSTLVDDAFVDIPILSTIFSMGFYFVLFCFVFGYSIAEKKWGNMVAFGMIIGLYVTLLLSPVAVFRYSFPIIILWPVFLMTILDRKNAFRISFRKRKKYDTIDR